MVCFQSIFPQLFQTIEQRPKLAKKQFEERLMCCAFVKAKHAVAKDPRKIVRTFHWRKLAKAAKSVPSANICESVFAQKAARENQNASRERVAKGTCERRAH